MLIMCRAGLLIALLVLVPKLATAQPAEVVIFPGAELDREGTEVARKGEIEMGGDPGEQHTWLYATDAAMDEVIAFYVAQGYSRQDEADWESFTQENFGVRIRRVVLVHPSTPFKFDARGLLLVFLERPYPRLKDFSDAPSPDNVVDRTGITITDLRDLR